MTLINRPASDFLPHRNGMLLLDQIIEADETYAKAQACIQPNNLFVHDQRMGAWVLLEYMAQTMGLWACWQAKQQGKPQPVGFLLGSRKLSLKYPFIEVGTTLIFEAHLIYLGEDGVAQFDCQTFQNDEKIAHAKINAFQPPNLKNFLNNLSPK